MTLVDIHQLIDLCVSECYFLYNNLIWKLYNSGPNGISLSCAFDISPKTFKRYVNDSHTRFENKQKPLQFCEILNKQDSSIQHTIQFENNQKQLNFSDITITNNGNNSYDFKTFKKSAITDVQIKSNSNMVPNVSVSVFKGFLCRAYEVCSECYIDE